MIYKEEKHCRICGGKLIPILDLGELYISDFVRPGEEGIKAPLVVAECENCGLVQLKHTVNSDSMYKKHYWYRSGLNKSMVKDLKNVVESAEKLIELENGDTVIDIGTNDGTLLSLYKNKNLLNTVGFDPAPNLAELASKNCANFINDYFTGENPLFWRTSVITSIAMLYDLPNPNFFVENVKICLDKAGIWIIQFTDLLSMLKVNAIDNLCSEHLELYRLFDVKNLVERHGLEIFKVEYNKVNGGSIRIYVSFPGAYSVDGSVEKSLVEEKEYLEIDSIVKLYDRFEIYKRKINYFLTRFPKEKVFAMAASTKGNTLLQLMGWDKDQIRAIGEINRDKIGLVTAGTSIPIIPEEKIFKYEPNLIVVLAWHFKTTFVNTLKNYVENGGLVLFPLPRPHIISSEGVIKL
jgi:NDP-4-keto-2,6-dideoxyhexose 3-C-methyltransferase